MKPLNWIILFFVIAIGVTIGNLIALKIASDAISSQVNSSLSSNPLLSFLAPKNKGT